MPETSMKQSVQDLFELYACPENWDEEDRYAYWMILRLKDGNIYIVDRHVSDDCRIHSYAEAYKDEYPGYVVFPIGFGVSKLNDEESEWLASQLTLFLETKDESVKESVWNTISLAFKRDSKMMPNPPYTADDDFHYLVAHKYTDGIIESVLKKLNKFPKKSWEEQASDDSADTVICNGEEVYKFAVKILANYFTEMSEELNPYDYD